MASWQLLPVIKSKHFSKKKYIFIIFSKSTTSMNSADRNMDLHSSTPMYLLGDTGQADEHYDV